MKTLIAVLLLFVSTAFVQAQWNVQTPRNPYFGGFYAQPVYPPNDPNAHYQWIPQGVTPIYTGGWIPRPQQPRGYYDIYGRWHSY